MEDKLARSAPAGLGFVRARSSGWRRRVREVSSPMGLAQPEPGLFLVREFALLSRHRFSNAPRRPQPEIRNTELVELSATQTAPVDGSTATATGPPPAGMVAVTIPVHHPLITDTVLLA